MIRHDVVCDRCGKGRWAFELGAIDIDGSLVGAGWFVGTISAASQNVVHLCPPCYQSWMNWWKQANGVQVSKEEQKPKQMEEV